MSLLETYSVTSSTHTHTQIPLCTQLPLTAMYDPVGMQEAEPGQDVAHVLTQQRLCHAAKLIQMVLYAAAQNREMDTQIESVKLRSKKKWPSF